MASTSGNYPIPAGSDAWATYVSQPILSVNSGWVLDQSGNDATGVFTTNCAGFSSPVAFQVAGDQTSIYLPGRRLRVVHTGGTTYTEVATAVFGAVTTVTIGVITSGPVFSGTCTSLAYALAYYSPTVGNYTAALPWQVLTRTTTTVVASTNSVTADSTLFTYAVPAAILGSSGILRLTVYGDYLNNSGGNINTAFKFLVGTSTVLAQTTAVTAGSSFGASANRRYWSAQMLLQNAGSASAQRVYGTFNLGAPSTQVFTIHDGVAPAGYWSEGYATSAEASTAAMTIAWLVRVASTAATVDCQLRGAVLEFAP